MSGWTKKNFDEIRDVSPEGVQIQWRFAREALGSPELGVSQFTYEPGADDDVCLLLHAVPVPPRHPGIGSRRPEGGDNERVDDFWD